MTHAQIVQAAAEFHREIRKVLLGVTECLCEHACALGTTDAMLDTHPNAG